MSECAFLKKKRYKVAGGNKIMNVKIHYNKYITSDVLTDGIYNKQTKSFHLAVRLF